MHNKSPRGSAGFFFYGRIVHSGVHFPLVTNQQLYLAIGVPLLFNTLLIGIVIAFFNSKFAAIDRRFDDMRDLWRAELRRVEDIIDARLKHLEERLP